MARPASKRARGAPLLCATPHRRAKGGRQHRWRASSLNVGWGGACQVRWGGAPYRQTGPGCPIALRYPTLLYTRGRHAQMARILTKRWAGRRLPGGQAPDEAPRGRLLLVRPARPQRQQLVRVTNATLHGVVARAFGATLYAEVAWSFLARVAPAAGACQGPCTEEALASQPAFLQRGVGVTAGFCLPPMPTSSPTGAEHNQAPTMWGSVGQ